MRGREEKGEEEDRRREGRSSYSWKHYFQSINRSLSG
jgi:hypothetical protein